MIMRINPLLLLFTQAALILAGCSGGGTSTAVVQPPTSPPVPSPLSVVVSPTPTETPTVTPTSSPTPTFRVSLEAVGDIMLARTVGEQVLAKGPQVVFAGVQSVLDSADIRIGNLECALTERGSPEKKTFPLKAPPQAARALALGKFDVLSLANNHAMDFGIAGLTDTQAALHNAGIATVGAGAYANAAHAPVIIERNGLRLAFLAYADVMPENSGFDAHRWIATETSPGIAWADPALIRKDVGSAKLQADLVIVLLHSGYEINSRVSFDQRTEAQAAIDAGAALVVGSHPHIVQAIEQYHGGLIAYSLGNFVFDQYQGIENASIILRVVLDRSGVVSHDYVPVLIENGLPGITPIENVRGIETLVAPVSTVGP
jgi:poly-gamma-glutamate capsule biosynthesis protein CapA/YwtB (metallophosphatase superfamily)